MLGRGVLLIDQESFPDVVRITVHAPIPSQGVSGLPLVSELRSSAFRRQWNLNSYTASFYPSPDEKVSSRTMLRRNV